MSSAVLMYHGVGDEAASHAELHYTVGEGAFASHLDALRGRPVVPLPFFLAGRAAPGSVILTFDDGERSVVTRALPLLEARRIVAAVFVTTAWIDTPGYLTAEELRLLAARGWTVGAHGHTHRFLSDLDPRALREELVTSRDVLTRVLGQPPEHMSLPGGRVSGAVVAAVDAAGFRSICTSVVGLNARSPDSFAVRRVMVLRGFDATTVARAAAGDRRFYWGLQARQGLLDGAKRALGNERYEALRRGAFGLLGSLRGRRP